MIFKKIIFIIYQFLYLQPRGYFSLKNERRLYKRKINSASRKQSIIFFTTHKAASSFFYKFFDLVAKKNDYIKINFDEFILRYPNKDTKNIYFENSRDKGFIFGPIRKFQRFDKIENFKVILLLRDPRDVLVSHFYSTMVSHPINSIKMIEKREYFKNKSIDNYVVDRSNWLLQIYQGYMNNLKNYHYIQYENLIQDSQKIIRELLKYLEISLDENIINFLSKELESPKVEDVKKHKRSGKAGQYGSHLKKETIEKLNNQFKNVLVNFDF